MCNSHTQTHISETTHSQTYTLKQKQTEKNKEFLVDEADEDPLEKPGKTGFPLLTKHHLQSAYLGAILCANVCFSVRGIFMV